MDVDGIMAKQLKQMEKERREKETKLRTQEKRVLHCLSPLPGRQTNPLANPLICPMSLSLSRSTTLSGRNGWWRFLCWRSSTSNRL